MGTTELGHRLRAGPSHVWQILNDWWLNIDTQQDARDLAEARDWEDTSDYRSHYQGANYIYLEQIARLVTKDAPQSLTFYDVGCGKGRPLCVMARHPFRKVIGVEYAPELAQTARINARKLRGRVAPIEVVCSDAAAVDYADGDVFFFFNPFGPPTLRAVIDSIGRSLSLVPRPVTIIYYNAVHEAVLEQTPWLECQSVLPTMSKVRISFWRNNNSLPEKGRGIA